jgi:hypothetical protein
MMYQALKVALFAFSFMVGMACWVWSMTAFLKILATDDFSLFPHFAIPGMIGLVLGIAAHLLRDRPRV